MFKLLDLPFHVMGLCELEMVAEKNNNQIFKKAPSDCTSEPKLYWGCC